MFCMFCWIKQLVRAAGGCLGRVAAGRMVLAVSLNGASASHLHTSRHRTATRASDAAELH